MKAAVFRGPGRPLEIESLSDPSPHAGEVVIRISRCGICGSDLHGTSAGDWMFPVDSIIGHEFSGEVVAVASDVGGYRIGDRVSAIGVFTCGRCVECLSGDPVWCEHRSVHSPGGAAQYARVQAHTAIRLPDSLSLPDAALAEPMACALHAVRLSMLPAGARVVVLGAGPMGLTTAFWARRLGASRVVVSSRSVRNEALAMRLGATRFIVSDRLSTQLVDALDGPCDVVFECVGSQDMLTRAMSIVRPRGTVVMAGICTACAPTSLLQLSTKEVRVQGSFGFDLREFQCAAAALDSDATVLGAIVTDTVSLPELPGAFEALRSPTTQCKVMIDPWA